MKDLYRETFSHVRSSYEFNMEDFERMNIKRRVSIRKTLLIAAVVAVLAALGITASATGFFGISDIVIPEEDGDGGIISLLGLADSPESRALGEYLNGEASLEEAASKYGLVIPDRCETFQYDEMSALLGGELFDGSNSKTAAYIYEDGTFGMDGDHTASDGTAFSYQLFRSVKGSLIDVSFSLAALGEGCENWNIDVDGVNVCLVLGGSRSLIAADMDGCFVIVLALTGVEGDGTFGGPITRGDLEELARSFNWDVLGRVVEPVFPPELPDVLYGAGVELDPEHIDESQSFQEILAGWGKIRFITYLPTPEFEDVRFFLSRDGKVSDYEFHPFILDGELDKVAAVSFEDLTGDGFVDVLAIIDYKNAGIGAGQDFRDVRIFTASGDGEFYPDWELMDEIKTSLDNIDVSSVRRYCRDKNSARDIPEGDSVLKTLKFSVGGLGSQIGRDMELDVIGKTDGNDRYGVRELRIYDMTSLGRTKPAQIIKLADIGGDFISGGIGGGYTDCWSLEETVQMRDMNFDGDQDIDVFGWVTNNTIPHYYFFWDRQAGLFKYALTLQGAMVDEKNGRVIAEYKSGEAGSEYTRDYYEPDGNGGLVLVDTEKSDYSQYYAIPGDAQAGDYPGVLEYLQGQDYEEYFLKYGLFDLTGDGTPELIAGYGTCEADAEAGVWSLDTGKLQKLGTFGMGHAQLYVDEEGRLVRLMGQMGYENVDIIGYDGSNIVETGVSERQLGPEDEYAVPGRQLDMWENSELGPITGAMTPDDSEKPKDFEGVITSLDRELDELMLLREYTLFDLTGDGEDELIVLFGETEADSTGRVYTMEGGDLMVLGEFDMSHSLLYGDGEKLLRLSGYMGSEVISEISFNGSVVTEKEISHRLLGEDDDYAAPGERLETAGLNDLYLLHGREKYAGYAKVLDGAGGDAGYALFDMDLDGTKELIVSEGGKWTFWTASDGKALKLGVLTTSKSSLHIYQDGMLVLFYSNMSGAEISRVLRDGDNVIVSRVTGWYWEQDGADEDPGPELEFTGVGDRSLIDGAG